MIRKESLLHQMIYFNNYYTMIHAIEDIIHWNTEAGNTPDKFNRHLETSMLAEELSEVIIWLKNKDKVEVVDWILDLFWVWVGTMYKMWVSAEQIEECFNEIARSNYSKFVDGKAIKDSTGKIIKPVSYFKPNLVDILK